MATDVTTSPHLWPEFHPITSSPLLRENDSRHSDEFQDIGIQAHRHKHMKLFINIVMNRIYLFHAVG